MKEEAADEEAVDAQTVVVVEVVVFLGRGVGAFMAWAGSRLLRSLVVCVLLLGARDKPGRMTFKGSMS